MFLYIKNIYICRNKTIMKRESYESNVKAMEIAKLFGSQSMQTSHYITIDNVLVRISNHYPEFCYLSQYNDIDNLDGVLFVFVGENAENFCNRLEEDSNFSNMNVDYYAIELEDEDNDYNFKMINKKVNNLK